jgi:RsmE family RNA methyltransferase
MNLILFRADEVGIALPSSDPRIIHIREILGMGVNDEFAAGIIGGATGRGCLTSEGPDGWNWCFVPLGESPPFRPVTLVLGCPRPPVARRLLKDMCTVGVREIRVCATDLNERSYITSKLWRDGLWREALIEGAVQAGVTRIPDVKTETCLDRALENLPDDAARAALDNGPGAVSFGSWKTGSREAVLAVGPERGWSDRERALLELNNFSRLHLGRRILRTETACSLGTGLLLCGIRDFDWND